MPSCCGSTPIVVGGASISAIHIADGVVGTSPPTASKLLCAHADPHLVASNVYDRTGVVCCQGAVSHVCVDYHRS